MTQRHSWARAIRTLFAACIAMLLAIGATVANADPYPPGYPKLKGSERGEFLASDSGHSQVTQLFVVETAPNAPNIRAYCIELGVPVTFGSHMDVKPWDQFPGNNKFKTDPQVRAKVAWIAHNSYPDRSLNDVMSSTGITGLTEKEAIAGTQASIWHLTDGFEYKGLYRSGSVDNASESAKRVEKLVKYLTGPANVGLPESKEPTIEVKSPAKSGVAGTLVGPFQVKSSKLTVQLKELPYPVVTGDGAAVDLKAVPTGVDLFLKVPQDAKAGSAVIEASVAGSVHNGQLLVTTASRNQTLILVDNHQVTVKAEGKIAWDAAPKPTPKPSPSPTPTPTPSKSPKPSPSPTPSKPSKPSLPKTGS